MEKRTFRSKKSRPRNARQNDRPNQGIFGKVYSTVREILQPTSWIFRGVSNWIGNSDETQSENSADIVEDTIREDNDVSHTVGQGNKRLRLRFEDNIPSIQSSGTQTWPEQPSQNLFESVPHVQTTTTQGSLLDNKEGIPVLNGDDHSENSEGSASTSGCSSLVSSHKDNNRAVENQYLSLRSELKSSRKRKEPSSPKTEFDDLNSSRNLWSSPSSKFQRRLPTISHTNQPSFNLSSFVGPSKLNESVEKKVASPFYEGKTTFGGASASRRMPPSVAPYQVDKTLRNQIKVRECHSQDNLEGMSSAAKRILLTLEKMSTPVADAKKMPNSETSPVDLSLYLRPPKSRRNSQFTPADSSKGPPIANINTIAKLSTLKNHGLSRLRSSLPGSPVASVGQDSYNFGSLPSNNITESVDQKSGGGKIRNKLNQLHHSSKPVNIEDEAFEVPDLPNIPLPITDLPIFNFNKPSDNSQTKGFKFSDPIEHDLAINRTVTASPFTLPPSLDTKIEKNSDLQPKPFVFSSPIEIEQPRSTVSTHENYTIPVVSNARPAVTSALIWKCSKCWVDNQNNRTSCKECESSRFPKDNPPSFNFKSSDKEAKTNPFASPLNSNPSAPTFSFKSPLSSPLTNLETSKISQSAAQSTLTSTPSNSVSSLWECASCWVRNPEKESKCLSCETSRPTKETSVKNSSIPSSSAMWECSECWVRNPVKESKCMACSSSRSPKENNKVKNSSIPSSSTMWECCECWVKNPVKESKCMACDSPRSPKKNNKVKNSPFPSSSTMWECSECWVKNPVKESKCMACGSPRSPKENNKGDTSNLVSQTTKDWVCSSCLVKNPAKETKCMACEAVHSSKDNTEVKKTVSSAPMWECTSCWVRNPMKEKKCLACETLHPDADKTSSLKDTNGFKFGTPLQNSPMTFKFGNYVCTAASTVTTSSFSFGLATSQSQTTTSTTGFKFGVPSSTSASSFLSSTTSTTNMTQINKDTVNTGSSQANRDTVNETLVVGKDSVKENNAVSVKNSVNEGSTPVVKDVGENKAENVGGNISKSLNAKSSESVSEQSKTISESKMSNSVITSISSETSVSKAKEGVTPSVTACFGFTTQPVLDSKKSETFPFGGVFPKEKVSSSSLPPSPFGVFTSPPVSKDKSTGDEKSLQPESKSTIVSSESKITPAFQFTSQPQQVSSAFTVLSSAPVFKFGEKTESNKTNLATISVAPTSTTNAGFSFSNNKSNPISVAESKDTKISSVTSETVSPFVKSEVTETTSTTTNTFLFGSTTTTSAPTAFSFFPSSSATTTTTVSPLFTFSASSNNAQTSKPGGFTFKSLEKPKNNAPESSATSVSSVSQPTTSILNTNSTAPMPSGGFVFGAPKTEAQSSAAAPFTFGSGSVSSSNTSAFSAFQPSQPANNTFQFGIQPTATTASTVGTTSNFSFPKSDMSGQVPTSVSQNPVSSFGAPTNNFVFGAKNETSNQIANTVTQASGIQFGSSTASFSFANKTENTSAVPQNSNPTFGMPGVFGNASVPTFGSTDKPASGGFNFATASSGVFQFGASNNSERKRPATASGFSFGTPAASEPNSSFQQSFNVVTPPSFNFGAASTPSGPGPFQFAASSAPKSPAAQSAPRKYRKALRRVRKD